MQVPLADPHGLYESHALGFVDSGRLRRVSQDQAQILARPAQLECKFYMVVQKLHGMLYFAFRDSITSRKEKQQVRYYRSLDKCTERL